MTAGRDQVLGGVPLFAALTEATRQRLAEHAASTHVLAGHWLLRQGEPGDDLYVLRSGRLELVIEEPPPPRVVRALGPGAVLGELALVVDQPRSASVRAVRDSELLRIGRVEFERALAEDPVLGVSLLRVMGAKLAASEELATAPPRAPTVFAVVPVGSGLPAGPMAEALAGSLQARGVVRVAGPDDAGDEPGRMLDRLEAEANAVVLRVDEGSPDSWVAFCRRQADRVVALARAEDPSPPGSGDLEGCDLVLVDRPDAPGVARWRDALRPRAHHLLADDGAMHRIARRVTGAALGVVLSGGGARGLAHLGVLQSLLAAGVVIDRVGGCSMGAFVAALVATGRDPAGAIEICRAELVRQRPFSDYTVPRVSLIRGRRARSMLARLFGDQRIELLPVDYFCVSADLFTADLVVHRSGRLADAVGASMSLPGFSPPVASGDHLAVDGGVLNNLPIDVMAGAAEGPVVAVDVMGRRRAFAASAPRALPSIVETISRATVLGSWRWVRASRDQADVVIEPDVARFGLFEWRALERIVEAGRRAGEAAAPAVLATLRGPR